MPQLYNNSNVQKKCFFDISIFFVFSERNSASGMNISLKFVVFACFRPLFTTQEIEIIDIFEEKMRFSKKYFFLYVRIVTKSMCV